VTAEEIPDPDLLVGIVEPFQIQPDPRPVLVRCYCGHQRGAHRSYRDECTAKKCPCPHYREDPRSAEPELLVTLSVAGQRSTRVVGRPP